MNPNNDWKPGFVLRSCLSCNSQTQAIFTDVGHPTRERKYVTRSLRTPGTGLGGVDNRPLERSYWNWRRKTFSPSGRLSVKHILEMFNPSRG